MGSRRWEDTGSACMQYADYFKAKLDALYASGQRRALRAQDSVGGIIDSPRGRLLNFSSNDYLNLATDPRLRDAAVAALERYGCGSTSSRLMAGELPVHAALEEALAGLVEQPAALAFPSGFQMNLAVVSALFDVEWTVYSDALNHASLIDGCRLSAATVHVYPHRDTEALEELLRSVDGPKAILTESVFSMDGDSAPLVELAGLARVHGAMLVVDEAHSIGIHGRGAGLSRQEGVLPDITLGTLGKSLGSGGGFVATSEVIRDVMINIARPFIFSTGISPANAEAARCAVEIVSASPDLGAELLKRAAYFRKLLNDAGLGVPTDSSPIIPIIVRENAQAVRLSSALRERNILAVAIRPPTVPVGTARLRLSLTLAHTDADVEAVAGAIVANMANGRARPSVAK
jgi:8-amino-7-oxononanoate synthase